MNDTKKQMILVEAENLVKKYLGPYGPAIAYFYGMIAILPHIPPEDPDRLKREKLLNLLEEICQEVQNESPKNVLDIIPQPTL